MIDPAFLFIPTDPYSLRSLLEIFSMPVYSRQTVLLTLVVLLGLGGCSGNYKFNDSGYRPLGDPQAVNRGK
jgi:hypothetical protein